MAKTTLPTNYVDDVLNGAMDGKRRYREIPNADGTISLEDATAYDQIGSNFGASQLNLMSDNINQSFDANKMLKTMDEVNAVTQEGYGVDALVVKQVNDSLQNENNESFNFGYLNGVRGFFTDSSRADDSFVPFSSKINHTQAIKINKTYTTFDLEIPLSKINGIAIKKNGNNYYGFVYIKQVFEDKYYSVYGNVFRNLGYDSGQVSNFDITETTFSCMINNDSHSGDATAYYF